MYGEDVMYSLRVNYAYIFFFYQERQKTAICYKERGRRLL